MRGACKDVQNIADPIRTYRVTAVSVSNVQVGPIATPTKPSIAVLPFDNMSDDHAQEYFSDGISEDLTTALSRFDWLFVIARNSAFTYKGKAVDVKRVGRELGVRSIEALRDERPGTVPGAPDSSGRRVASEVADRT